MLKLRETNLNVGDVYLFLFIFVWTLFSTIEREITIWFISGYFPIYLVMKEIVIIFIFSLIYFLVRLFTKKGDRVFIVIFIFYSLVFNGNKVVMNFPYHYTKFFTFLVYFVGILASPIGIYFLSEKYVKWIKNAIIIFIFIAIVSRLGDLSLSRHIFSKYVVELNDDNVNNVNRKNFPNIYYILPDAYLRPDMIRYYFKYDDYDFVDSLKSKGFFYVKKSVANYVQTLICLPSILNYTYADSFVNLRKAQDVIPLYLSKNGPRIIKTLKKLGYTTVSFETGFYEYLGLTTVDKMYYYPYSFKVAMANITLKMPFFLRDRLIRPINRVKLHNKQIYDKNKFVISKTMEWAKKKGKPHLIFTHLFAPHPPFVFDSLGNFRPMAYTIDYERYHPQLYREHYVSEVKYVNKLLLAVIDTILKYDPHSIIIVSSDHGTDVFLRSSLDKTDIRERFSNMTFIYFPDKNYANIPDNLSPVNIFRLVLARVTGRNYNLLDNLVFYSIPDHPQISGFIDVTREYEKLLYGNSK